MFDKIYDFLLTYCNCTNVAVLLFCIMAVLFIVWCIFGGERVCSLKKINAILKDFSGREAIMKIESLKLSKRFRNMWDQYYEAYNSETTVSLDKYLACGDMLVPSKIFRYASLSVAAVGFGGACALMFRLQALPVLERTNLLILFFVCIALAVFFDFLYYTVGIRRQKKVMRLIEEFKILSVRKLPGQASSFEQVCLISEINELKAQIREILTSCNVLNARVEKLTGVFEPKDEPAEENK